MLKSKNKGDDNINSKDMWLVLGLTVILAVAVSISTVSITGDAIFGKATITKTPTKVNLPNIQILSSCKFISYEDLTNYYGSNLYGTGKDGNTACGEILASQGNYGCSSVTYCTDHFVYDDLTCKKIKYIDQYYRPQGISKCSETIGTSREEKCNQDVYYVGTSNEQRFGYTKGTYYEGILCCKAEL